MQIKNRNIGLDVLRAIAICMVLIDHGISVQGIPVFGEFATGVDLFFVLSGFLIGRIYFRSHSRQDFQLFKFWGARWWRTIPPYLLAMPFYLVTVHFIPGPEPKLHWYYLLFLQNMIGIDGLGPTWSLCVEEHFYLLLPLLAMLIAAVFGRKSFRWVLPVFFFIPMAMRYATVAVAHQLPYRWFFMSPYHCEGLIAGVYLSYLFVEDHDGFIRIKKASKWLLPVIPLMLFILPLWHTRGDLINSSVFTVEAIGFAAWVRVLYDMEWNPSGVAGKFMHWAARGLALSSYSIYLTHVTSSEIGKWLLFHGLHRGVVKSLSILSTSLVIGTIFYFLVERPTIVTRDRFLNGSPSPKPVLEPSVHV